MEFSVSEWLTEFAWFEDVDIREFLRKLWMGDLRGGYEFFLTGGDSLPFCQHPVLYQSLVGNLLSIPILTPTFFMFTHPF